MRRRPWATEQASSGHMRVARWRSCQARSRRVARALCGSLLGLHSACVAMALCSTEYCSFHER